MGERQPLQLRVFRELDSSMQKKSKLDKVLKPHTKINKGDYIKLKGFL